MNSWICNPFCSQSKHLWVIPYRVALGERLVIHDNVTVGTLLNARRETVGAVVNARFAADFDGVVGDHLERIEAVDRFCNIVV
ncbi:hypothetical protein GCK72_016709 [Caenorhabditis remanei]|uniref:Uncharacterized protein n=1 Tax=Caenorhabditis remanei TaxID=31234 RepID=A0A6A5G605_CAERE|nr:hypothetical protein GCK72_016709 [Caenorhabditis remanei]KAF1750162.1 hypothetical protein GCK72_016709 [Caenorhabditis remanei]